MIYLLHENRYWTEYLDSLLEETAHFSIIRSERCKEDSYHDISLEPFNPKKHKVILSAGYVYDHTDNNLILCRYHHSPGFNVHPMIEGYFRLLANHPTSDFRYILLEEHYKLLMLTEHLPPNHDYVRSKMIQDPRVCTSAVDCMLLKIKNTPKQADRTPSTVLIAPSWHIAKEDPNLLKNIHQVLSKEMDMTLVLHPLTLAMGGNPKFVQTAKEIFGTNSVLFNIPRSEMIRLYDQHEFILTDGSGSIYEAMVRGCKPLLIGGLNCQKESQEFHSAYGEGYLDFPDYRDYRDANLFDIKSFLLQHFPYIYSYTMEEAEKILKEEMLSF